jgi:lipoyl(octanoyl) transferase
MLGFQEIIPCGIADKPVSSLAEWIPGITPQEVRVHIARCFAQVFGVELIED